MLRTLIVVARMVVAHAPPSRLIQVVVAGRLRIEATAAASRAAGAGRQVYKVASAAGELSRGGGRDGGGALVEVVEVGAELEGIEWGGRH